MSDGKIIQENGENIIPITHETCVLDDEGNPITETIGDVSLLSTESRNLVGAINEVFGDIIKEQLVVKLNDNNIDATTNETWSELIEKIDTKFDEIKTHEEENKAKWFNILKLSGFDVNENDSMDNMYNEVYEKSNATKDVKQIDCGGLFTIVQKKDNTLWCTGYNGNGQLGLGHNNNISVFTQITDMGTDVKQIACGNQYVLLLKNDGTVWAAGNNQNYQCGISGTTSFNIFKQVSVDNVKQIACGTVHSMIVKNDGSLWGCGYTQYDRTGLGHGTGSISSFTKVNNSNINNDVKEVFCSDFGSYILKNDGTVWVCGYNQTGCLGLGNNNNVNSITKVNIDNVKQIACGLEYTMIVKNDGTLWATGGNGYGQLGLGDTANKYTFTQVTDNVSSVSCGYEHTFILKNDGSVWSCGRNNGGQLGIGVSDNNPHSTFTQVNIDNVKQVICSDRYTIIIKNNDSLWGCGYNGYGELGMNDITARNIFVNRTGFGI